MNTILLILLFLLYLLILRINKTNNLLIFYLSILCFIIRPIEVEENLIFNTSYFLFLGLFISNLNKVYSTLKNWNWILLIFLLSLISLLFREYNFQSFKSENIIRDALVWFNPFLIMIIISSVTRIFVKDLKTLNKSTNMFLFVIITFTVTGLLSYYGVNDGFVLKYSILEDNLSNYSRVFGITNGNLVYILLPTAIPFFLDNKKHILKVIFFISICLVIVLSNKRTAIISLFLILSFVYIPNKRYLFVTVVIILFSLFLFEYNFNSILTNEFYRSGDKKRMARLMLGYNAFLEKPFFGHGMGYYGYIHNIFIEILANFGLIGIFILKPFQKALIDLKNNWNKNILTFFLTLGLFEAGFARIQIMYFLGFFIGMAYSQNKIHIYERQNKLINNNSGL